MLGIALLAASLGAPSAANASNGGDDNEVQTFTSTPAPVVVGTIENGATVSVGGKPWIAPVPIITFTYQWMRAGVDITGADDATYALTSADVGHGISVRETGSAIGILTVSMVSAATGHVAAADLTTPTPTITGTKAVGQILTAVANWTPGTVTYSYRWKRNGDKISHATHATYMLTQADAGQHITVTVKGVETGYKTVSKTSAHVTIEKVLTATPIPKISGTPTVGHTLTAITGSWKPSKVTLHYAWMINGVVIGTGSTYVVTSANAGKTIWLAVTGSKTGYTSVTRLSLGKLILAS